MNKHVEYDADLETVLRTHSAANPISGVWILPFVIIGAIFWVLAIWGIVSLLAPTVDADYGATMGAVTTFAGI